MGFEDRRVLQFRCATNERRFVALFSRKKPTERFRFENAIDEKDLTGQEAPAAAWKAPVPQAPTLTPTANAPIAGLLQGVTNALKIFSRSKTDLASTKKTKAHQKHANRTTTNEFNMDEFDFRGWYCPCCGHNKHAPARVRFVRCSRCREYICGVGVIQIDDEHLEFNCHERCGNRGDLGFGTLSSMKGVDFDIPIPSELKGGSGKLPAPPSLLNSGKDKQK